VSPWLGLVHENEDPQPIAEDTASGIFRPALTALADHERPSIQITIVLFPFRAEVTPLYGSVQATQPYFPTANLVLQESQLAVR